MRLTLRHRYDFGADRPLVGSDLVRPESWDALRMESDGAFALPATRAEWERAADARPEIERRARAMDGWLEAGGVGRLASYGAGAALPELWLWRVRPERELVLTDYAPESVDRLGRLFPEGTIRLHDLRVDGPLAADMHLFHRIDSEFSDSEWRAILERFADARVLLVATEVLGPRRLLDELVLRLPGSGATRAGWIRTAGAFEALWRPTHDAVRLDLFDLPAWALEPRGRGLA